jgi:hypothetical protein
MTLNALAAGFASAAARNPGHADASPWPCAAPVAASRADPYEPAVAATLDVSAWPCEDPSAPSWRCLGCWWRRRRYPLRLWDEPAVKNSSSPVRGMVWLAMMMGVLGRAVDGVAVVVVVGLTRLRLRSTM